jgi:hypothetical protein
MCAIAAAPLSSCGSSKLPEILHPPARAEEFFVELAIPTISATSLNRFAVEVDEVDDLAVPATRGKV